MSIPRFLVLCVLVGAVAMLVQQRRSADVDRTAFSTGSVPNPGDGMSSDHS